MREHTDSTFEKGYHDYYKQKLGESVKKQEWVNTDYVITFFPGIYLHAGFIPALMEMFDVDDSKILRIKHTFFMGHVKSIRISFHKDSK